MLLYAVTSHRTHTKMGHTKVRTDTETKSWYLVLGSPLSFPDVRGHNSLRFLS
jgi:hypothetical protein